MIEHTFIHISGIGKKTEARLWARGCDSCDMLLGELDMMDDHTNPQRNKAKKTLERSVASLEERNWKYFYDVLPAKEHWRLIPVFDRIGFLDIETTGLGYMNNHITAIGIYDGTNFDSYIYGRNLDDFMEDIHEYDAIVTYNGKAFDIPFIEATFGKLPPLIHIDLRYLLAGLGFKGGLKKIEKQAGIDRGEGMEDIDGFLAVLLWKEYTDNGNRNALETLIAYNLEDVINLKPLAAKVYNMNLPEQYEHLMLPEDIPHPDIPYTVDKDLVAKLKYNVR